MPRNACARSAFAEDIYVNLPRLPLTYHSPQHIADTIHLEILPDIIKDPIGRYQLLLSKPLS